MQNKETENRKQKPKKNILVDFDDYCGVFGMGFTSNRVLPKNVVCVYTSVHSITTSVQYTKAVDTECACAYIENKSDIIKISFSNAVQFAYTFGIFTHAPTIPATLQ